MKTLALVALSALSTLGACRHAAPSTLAEDQDAPLPPWLDWRADAIDWTRPAFGHPSYYGILFDFAGDMPGLAKVSLKLEHIYPAPGMYHVNMQTHTKQGAVTDAGPENPQMSCAVSLATPDPLFPRPYVDAVHCASAVVPAGGTKMRIDVAYNGVGTFEADGTGYFHYALRLTYINALGDVNYEASLPEGALKASILD